MNNKRKRSRQFSNTGPQKVFDLLQGTLGRYGLKRKLEKYALFPEWNLVVGEDIAKVSEPVKIIHGKILLVRVASSAWAEELSFKKQEILDKIYFSGKGLAVEDIKFIVDDPMRLVIKDWQ